METSPYQVDIWKETEKIEKYKIPKVQKRTAACYREKPKHRTTKNFQKFQKARNGSRSALHFFYIQRKQSNSLTLSFSSKYCQVRLPLTTGERVDS